MLSFLLLFLLLAIYSWGLTAQLTIRQGNYLTLYYPLLLMLSRMRECAAYLPKSMALASLNTRRSGIFHVVAIVVYQ